MDIEIRWQEPIQLTHNWHVIVDENDLPEAIRIDPAVYFFSRKYGARYLPFYIGETTTLRTRLKNHLNWTKLTDVLKGVDAHSPIRQGQRYFHYGYFIAKRGQRAKTCIQIVQKHLVREAMAQNLPLLNKKLTTVKVHNLKFVGDEPSRAIYAKKVEVEQE